LRLTIVAIALPCGGSDRIWGASPATQTNSESYHWEVSAACKAILGDNRFPARHPQLTQVRYCYTTYKSISKSLFLLFTNTIRRMLQRYQLSS
jgi:hypothetical protein